ncbi:hypothetical protein [Microbulbifer variabilis]|uniref:hypothetical protein n=1 Tax=Microbulbifer variabilis TaxID=266805 RepID=UPI001CFE16F4|nr:hypothetical protein [Microbulbifer variabilis]
MIRRILPFLASDGHRNVPGSGALVHNGAIVRLAHQLQFELTRITGHTTKDDLSDYLFEATDGDDDYTVTSQELSQLGFTVEPINPCMVRIIVGIESLQIPLHTRHSCNSVS